jgi:hypothetical protein
VTHTRHERAAVSANLRKQAEKRAEDELLSLSNIRRKSPRTETNHCSNGREIEGSVNVGHGVGEDLTVKLAAVRTPCAVTFPFYHATNLRCSRSGRQKMKH